MSFFRRKFGDKQKKAAAPANPRASPSPSGGSQASSSSLDVHGLELPNGDLNEYAMPTSPGARPRDIQGGAGGAGGQGGQGGQPGARPKGLPVRPVRGRQDPILAEDGESSRSLKADTPVGTSSRLSKTLHEVLHDRDALPYLVQYLESRGTAPLIRFWLDAESFQAAAGARLQMALRGQNQDPGASATDGRSSGASSVSGGRYKDSGDESSLAEDGYVFVSRGNDVGRDGINGGAGEGESRMQPPGSDVIAGQADMKRGDIEASSGAPRAARGEGRGGHMVAAPRVPDDRDIGAARTGCVSQVAQAHSSGANAAGDNTADGGGTDQRANICPASDPPPTPALSAPHPGHPAPSDIAPSRTNVMTGVPSCGGDPQPGDASSATDGTPTAGGTPTPGAVPPSPARRNHNANNAKSCDTNPASPSRVTPSLSQSEVTPSLSQSEVTPAAEAPPTGQGAPRSPAPHHRRSHSGADVSDTSSQSGDLSRGVLESPDSLHPADNIGPQDEASLQEKLKKNIAQDAVNIFTKYLAHDAAHPIGVSEELRNDVIKRICLEDGLVDPKCFSDCQDFAVSTINSAYYPGFLVSEYHCKHQIDILTGSVIRLSDVLFNDGAMVYFTEYMERECAMGLLQCWMDLENFQQLLVGQQRESGYDGRHAQSDAMVLYEKYFSLQATHPLGFDDAVRFEVECNICREEGPLPDCFAEPKRMVLRTMGKSYLDQFLKSDLYFKYLSDLINTVQLATDMPQYTRRKRTGSESSELSLGSLHSTGSDVVSTRNTLLAIDTSGLHMRKALTRIEADMRMDGSLFNPNALWERHLSGKMSLGKINEFGQFVSDFSPEPDHEKKKKGTFFKSKREKDKEQEDVAMQIARMIISDVTAVTAQAGETLS